MNNEHDDVPTRSRPRHIIPDDERVIIDAFFRRHCPASPNKNELIVHQNEVRHKLLRVKTFNELWIIFKEEHPELASKYESPHHPSIFPTLLRVSMPWEIRTDTKQYLQCYDFAQNHTLGGDGS